MCDISYFSIQTYSQCLLYITSLELCLSFTDISHPSLQDLTEVIMITFESINNFSMGFSLPLIHSVSVDESMYAVMQFYQ